MAAPAQTAPDPRARTATGRLLQGFAYPFRAVGFMFRHPRLWTYALVPIGISLVLLSVLFVALVYQAGHLTGLIWARPASWYGELAWYGLYFLVFAGTFVIGALALPALIASPFNDTLSERAEGLALDTDAAQKLTVGKLVRDVGRVLADQSLRILLLLLGHAVILGGAPHPRGGRPPSTRCWRRPGASSGAPPTTSTTRWAATPTGFAPSARSSARTSR